MSESLQDGSSQDPEQARRWSRLARCIGGDLHPQDTLVAEHAALVALPPELRPVPLRDDLDERVAMLGCTAARLAVAMDDLFLAGGHATRLDTDPRVTRLRQLLDEVGVQPQPTLARLTELTRSVWGEALLDVAPAPMLPGAAAQGDKDVD